jgi:ABC-2 type transport system ATP-binding protein
MTEPIITVEGLYHRFGDLAAVDGVDFTVEKGEIFSFLGPNGAGKTTTINVLTTLLPLQEGRVKVAGHDVARQPDAVRRSIGIVFQNETLDRDLTVAETLEFHGRLYGMRGEERRSRASELLRLVELGSKVDVRTKYLSGGMKRRLEIARGLMTRPEVLFLDEPTIGLDPQTRLRIWEQIRAINEEGTTIFLTTHYMDEADMLSNRISIIDHGRIIVTGTPEKLKNTLGRDVIYVNTADDDKAGTLFMGHCSVRDVSSTKRGLAVTVAEEGSHCLPIMLGLLKDAGIGVESVYLHRPTMDDVFVHYTGRELRDEANTGSHSRRRH